MAETRNDAVAAFNLFLEAYRLKYEKAPECLEKDRDELLAFYEFPAEHWKHLRTSNPIESQHLHHRTPPHDSIEGLPVEHNHARHGVQTRRRRSKKLALSRRTQPVAEGLPRCQVFRRAGSLRRCRSSAQSRHLNHKAVTKIWR